MKHLMIYLRYMHISFLVKLLYAQRHTSYEKLVLSRPRETQESTNSSSIIKLKTDPILTLGKEPYKRPQILFNHEY